MPRRRFQQLPVGYSSEPPLTFVCLDAGDVGSQEVDPVSVQVAAGSVVVLGTAWVDVAGQDLGVSERYARVESVGDGSVPQGVRADVARNTGDLRDPGDHAVDVATVYRLAGDRPKDEPPAGALSPAGFQDAEDGHGDRHGCGLVALADQAQYSVAS